jgi:hypothetical protein
LATQSLQIANPSTANVLLLFRALLNRSVGFDMRMVAEANADAVSYGSPEVSMLDVAGQPPCQLSPDDIDVPTTNVRPRVRLVRNSPYGKRAERLARYIMEQFSKGLDDEEALFESAIWQEQHFDAVRYPPDA